MSLQRVREHSRDWMLTALRISFSVAYNILCRISFITTLKRRKESLSMYLNYSLIRSLSHPLQLSPILLINNHQPLHAPFIQYLRIHHKSSQYNRLFCRTRIITNLMMASWHLVERSSSMKNLHWVIVHFVQHAAFEYNHCNKCPGVCMWRGGAVGWEGDLKTDDGFAWGVGEGVLVEGEDGREWSTGEMLVGRQLRME